MNPLMDIFRQKRASQRPGYNLGASVHGTGTHGPMAQGLKKSTTKPGGNNTRFGGENETMRVETGLVTEQSLNDMADNSQHLASMSVNENPVYNDEYGNMVQGIHPILHNTWQDNYGSQETILNQNTDLGQIIRTIDGEKTFEDYDAASPADFAHLYRLGNRDLPINFFEPKIEDMSKGGRVGFEPGGFSGGYNVSGNQDFYEGSANIGGTLGPLDMSVNMSKTKGSDIEKEATVRFEKEMSMIDGLVVDGYYSKAESDEARFNAGVRFHKEIANGFMFNSYLQTDGIDKSGGAGITYSFNKGGRVSRGPNYDPNKRGLVDGPGGYFGGHGGEASQGSPDASQSSSGDQGQGDGKPDHLGLLGLNMSLAPEQNPHHDYHSTTDPYGEPPSKGGEDKDEAEDKKSWWTSFLDKAPPKISKFMKAVFNKKNLRKGLMAIALSQFNFAKPIASLLGINELGTGLAAMGINLGIMAEANQDTDMEKAQDAVDKANQSYADADKSNPNEMSNISDAMTDAEAQMDRAVDMEAAHQAQLAQDEKDDRGGHKLLENEMLAQNPYQGWQNTNQQGSAPPNYSHFILSEDEQTMSDSLVAQGYALHTAIQYAMHYHNNPEAPPWGA